MYILNNQTEIKQNNIIINHMVLLMLDLKMLLWV